MSFSKAVIFGLLVAAVSSFTIQPLIFGSSGTEDFYKLCGQENVKCAAASFRSELENVTTPDYTDCIGQQNCTRGIAMETSDNGTLFYLFGTGENTFVSVGFSDDLSMGEETVVSCVKREDGIVAELSYNEGYHNQAATSDDGVSLIDYSWTTAGFFCTFTLDDPMEYARNGQSNDTDYFLIGVAGSLKDDGTFGSHGRNHFLSGSKWTLPTKIADKDGAGAIAASLLLISASMATNLRI